MKLSIIEYCKHIISRSNRLVELFGWGSNVSGRGVGLDSQGNKNAWENSQKREKIRGKLNFGVGVGNRSTRQASNGCVLQYHGETPNEGWEQKIHNEAYIGSSKSIIYDVGWHRREARQKYKSPTISLYTFTKHMEVVVPLNPLPCWTWSSEYQPASANLQLLIINY